VSDSRLRSLFIVLLSLAFLRFLVIPWVESQSQRRDELIVLTDRLVRSEALIEAREVMLARSKRLSEILKNYSSKFPRVSSPDQYRLMAQQQVSAIAAESGVSLTLFDVILDGNNPNSGLNFIRSRIQFQGPLNGVARFHGALEGNLQNLLIQNFKIDSAFPISEPGAALVTGSVTMDMYFETVEQPSKEK